MNELLKLHVLKQGVSRFSEGDTTGNIVIIITITILFLTLLFMLYLCFKKGISMIIPSFLFCSSLLPFGMLIHYMAEPLQKVEYRTPVLTAQDVIHIDEQDEISIRYKGQVYKKTIDSNINKGDRFILKSNPLLLKEAPKEIDDIPVNERVKLIIERVN